ncbi:MAG: sulfotransferase domain-containing protein [Porticoccus sp.]|nr:sulfotransferase domain-containing protein [Porticoccus sp.]
MFRLMNSSVRRYMVSAYSLFGNSVIINEFPKSGGTWLGQMLSDLLLLPFPRNRIPTSSKVILHGHYINNIKRDKTIIVWRDGRDVLISWYFHSLFYNNVKNKLLVDDVRFRLKFSNFENLSENLVDFIEYTFTNQVHPKFSWSQFVDRWYSDDTVLHVKYEDLRSNTISELSRLVEHLSDEVFSHSKISSVVDKFSFERQSGRRPGVEKKNNFMRKGIVGDWKNQFDLNSRKAFDFYAGDSLIKLGYEFNHNWVKSD